MMAPLDNVPLFFKIAAYLNPLKYFIALMRNIMLKGGTADQRKVAPALHTSITTISLKGEL